MNPTLLTDNKKLTFSLIAILGLSLIIILISWLLRPSFVDHQISQLPLRADSDFAHLEGDHIYAYNGLAFYRTPVADGSQVEVLSSGLKLPTPERIYWAGDKGALVNFASSFTRTAVKSQLDARGQDIDDVTEQYTWFVDFKTDKLTLVDDLAIIPDGVFYSDKANGYYFLPDLSGVEVDNPEAQPLHFFSLTSRHQTTINPDLGLVDISHIGHCADESYQVCLVGRSIEDTIKQRLVAIDKAGKSDTLREQTGRIIATNDPNRYLTSEIEQFQSEDYEDLESYEVEESPAKLFTVSDKKTYDLDFTIGNQTLATSFHGDKFYVLDSRLAGIEGDGTYLTGAKGLFGALKTAERELNIDDAVYVNGLLGQPNYGNDGRVMFESIDGDFVVASPTGSAANLNPSSEDVATQAVDSCLKHANAKQYFSDSRLFRILVNDDSNFDKKVSAFSDCLSQKPQAMLGYHYYFGGISPVNGRITTD